MMLNMKFHRVYKECGTIHEGFGEKRASGIELVIPEDAHKITVSLSDELECDSNVATIFIPWGKIEKVEILPQEKEKQIKRIRHQRITSK